MESNQINETIEEEKARYRAENKALSECPEPTMHGLLGNCGDGVTYDVYFAQLRENRTVMEKAIRMALHGK